MKNNLVDHLNLFLIVMSYIVLFTSLLLFVEVEYSQQTVIKVQFLYHTKDHNSLSASSSFSIISIEFKAILSNDDSLQFIQSINHKSTHFIKTIISNVNLFQ